MCFILFINIELTRGSP